MLAKVSRRIFLHRRNLKTLALAVLFLGFVLSGPPSSLAAEAVFPEGSHFGLIPPPGFSSASEFTGFLAPGIGGSIIIEEMPSASFKHFQSMDMAAGMARIGVTVTATSSEKFGGLNGIAIMGRQNLHNIPHTKCILFLQGTTGTAMISLQVPEKNSGALGGRPCIALTTVVERTDAGNEPALPFELTDMGGMRTVENQPKGGMYLTAGPKKVVENAEQPLLMIAPSQSPAPTMGRGTFSRFMLKNLTALGNAKIVSETPLQIDGAPGYEIIASGTYGNTNVPIAAVQWIRFSKARSIRITGFVAVDQKDTAFAAFRRVRDGLRAK